MDFQGEMILRKSARNVYRRTKSANDQLSCLHTATCPAHYAPSILGNTMRIERAACLSGEQDVPERFGEENPRSRRLFEFCQIAPRGRQTPNSLDTRVIRLEEKDILRTQKTAFQQAVK